MVISSLGRRLALHAPQRLSSSLFKGCAFVYPCMKPLGFLSKGFFSTSPTSLGDDVLAQIPSSPLPDSNPVSPPGDSAFHLHEMQEYGLGNLHTPTGLIQSAIEALHSGLGLPWWLSIVAYSAVLKLTFLYFNLNQTRSNIRINNLKPELTQIKENIAAYSNNSNFLGTRAETFKMKKLMSKNKCGMARTCINVLVPMPAYICTFMALRDISQAKLMSFSVGGLAWFTNLNIPDPYFVLPLFSALSMLINYQISKWMFSSNSKYLYFYIGFTLISLPITANMSCVFLLYFCTVSVINMLQAIALRFKFMRKLLRIPEFIKWNASGPENPGFFEMAKKLYNRKIEEYARMNQLKNPASLKVPEIIGTTRKYKLCK